MMHRPPRTVLWGGRETDRQPALTPRPPVPGLTIHIGPPAHRNPVTLALDIASAIRTRLS